MRNELQKSKVFEMVESPADADAVLAGDAEVYVLGYYSLYARAGRSPANGNPVYGGYTSVELKSHSGETVWSYLSTLRSGSTDPARDISRDIARHLIAVAFPNRKTER
ncbi:MAG: hypothetical protein JOY54_09700 [Acidobacteriaceae bacterium]|nr:hypothetical protein [Acidobacteriaceae bacterium]